MQKHTKKLSYFQSIKNRDPAARNSFQILFTYPGVKALVYYRVAHFLFSKWRAKTLAELISCHARKVTGIEIHPGARIGKRLFIDHGSGTVIGETAIIGDDCLIHHGVTLGSTGSKTIGHRRHPELKNNVMIGAHATLIGPITIGDNAKIGANTLILKNVEKNEVVKADISNQKLLAVASRNDWPEVTHESNPG